MPHWNENWRYRHVLMPTYLDYVSRVSWADHAISLGSAAVLWQFCLDRRPARVLDTGSGYSSYVLRRYAQEHGAQVVSVDDNAEWMKKTAGYLAEHGLSTDGLMSWDEFRASQHQHFGLVFHDMAGGRLRIDTAQRMTDLIEDDGVLVFDDMQDLALRAEVRRVTAAAGRRYLSMERVTGDEIGRYAALSVR